MDTIRMLLVAGCSVASVPAARAQTDLLGGIDEGRVRAWVTRDATVFRDPGAGSITMTFRPVAGEPEVRVSTRSMGWPSDWSRYGALAFRFHATSLEPVSIGFSDGSVTKAMILEPLEGIRIQAVIPLQSFTQTRTMTPLLPLGYKAWPERLFTFEKVDEIVFRMRYPSRPSQLTLYDLRLTADVPADDIVDRRPLIDRYGQWIPENWPGKAHGDDELARLWADDTLPPDDFGRCPLGGELSRTLAATGFFRTQRVESRWILVDPHGHPFFSAGMDLVGWNPSSFATSVERREFLFEELPAPGPAWLEPAKVVSFYVRNIAQRHGGDWRAGWSRAIVGRLKAWGFNTIANWSDRELAAGSGMPYVLPLSGWTTRKTFPFPYDFPDVFSREFEANVEAAARRQCKPLADDPNLIGWFIGNEPHWARRFGALQSWPEMLLADPEPSATKETLERMLAAAKPAQRESIRDEFLYACARRYFDVIVRAIRRHDPNHLDLGIRFAENPGDRWIELSRVFDAFSINIYSDGFAPDPARIRRYAEGSGKPVVIGEFTAAAAGRGLQGLFYFGHKVKDQEERGKAYRYYVENSAADPYIVGTHWFQLVDDLPTGRPSDEERLNYGFVNVVDLPYPELVKAARETHRRLYDLKFGRTTPVQAKPRPN